MRNLRRFSQSGQVVSVRRIRACEPVAGVVEASIILERSGGCWAMAVRLERSEYGWQCQVLTVV